MAEPFPSEAELIEAALDDREAQGFPRRMEDPVALAKIAALFATARKSSAA